MKEMNSYIGVKLVMATAMTLGEYNTYRGWEIPENGDPLKEGFLVEYPVVEGDTPNHQAHVGYISWCPKVAFETANRRTEAMTFGLALEEAKTGKKIARTGWNGRNQFVVMQPRIKLPPFNTQGKHRKVNDRTAKFIGQDKSLNCPPYCCLYNAQEEWLCGWNPSQGDLFAEDWIVVL